MSEGKGLSYRRLTIAAVVLMLGVGGLIVALDWRQVILLFGKARWPVLVAALAVTAVSYLCAAESVVAVLRVFGIERGRSRIFRVGLVSVVLENLIANPAGLSLRLLILGRRGIDNSRIIGSSILLSYFKNVLFLALIPVSLVYVIFTFPLFRVGVVTIIFVALVLTIVVAGATAIIFSLRLRTVILRIVARLWHFVTHRNIESSLAEFGSVLSEGIADLKRRPQAQVPLAALILADVGTMILTLWLCFQALGLPIHLGALIAGFNFGITLTIVSFIPGDLGVQEASMAGVFALFGVPFSQGVLVAILFRVVYYFVPFIVSSAFYWDLLRGLAKE
jgi:uncharacterized protein (TIRG00374 family)